MFRVMRWNPFLNADPGAEGGGDPNGEGGQQQPGKVFTQAEVDAMMASRWKDNEMTKAELKELADLVKQFGYEGSTPAEIKAQVKAELGERQKKVELAQLQQEAKTNGTSPELLSEINELKKKLATIDNERAQREQAIQQQQAATTAWNQQVALMQEKHADVDMEKLAQNQRFIRFLSKANPAIPLHEVYEDYIDLVGDAEKTALAKIQSNNERSTSSGKSKGDPAGGTFGLSSSQQQLAKQNGMSFKEYADLLKDIQ